MMMSALREKTKVVLFIALLAFVGLIFFEWGMQSGTTANRGAGGAQVIGTVNGRDISGDDYRRTRASLVQSFEARTGRAPGFADYDAIEEEAWLTSVRQTLVEEQLDELGIVVSDSEILETLKTNPPAEIRAQFSNAQGQFDPIAYQQALANPAMAQQWASVEGYLRTIMPGDKLTNYVGLNAHVTRAEIRERFLAANEKVKVAYVVSSPAAQTIAEGAITDSQLRAYYEANPDEFQSAATAVLEYVFFSKEPTAQDSSDARADLEDVRAQIVGGADFADEARAWSDDSSAERGGDLGQVKRGDMVPEFEEMAFNTPVGEVSPVFASTFGYHILQVDGIEEVDGEETRQVRHILIRVEPSNETLRDARDAADDFLFALEEGTFEAAAAEVGAPIETTEPFEAAGIIPGIGLNRAAIRFAFSQEPGATTSQPIEDDRGVYAFRLKERRPAGLQAFDEVKTRVEVALRNELQREQALAAMTSAVANHAGDLEAIANALGAPVDTTIEFSRDSFVPGVGRRNGFVANAFALAKDETSALVESDRGFYVMKVVDQIPADEATLVEQTDQIRQQLLVEKRQELISSWIENLLVNADVEDLRSGNAVPWQLDENLITYGGV